MSDRWWEDETLGKKPLFKNERSKAGRRVAESRRVVKKPKPKKYVKPKPLTSWDEIVQGQIDRTKPQRPGLSADAADRRAAARAKNVSRGASAFGGPGRAELEDARKPVKSVRELQLKLRKAGFQIKVDGIMGPETRRVLSQYEQAMNKVQNVRTGRDLIADPDRQDNDRLLKEYGFAGASQVKDVRRDVAQQRSLIANQLNTAKAAPGPAPEPGLGDRLEDYVSALVHGRGRDDSLASIDPGLGATAMVASDLGEIAFRPAQVWATSLMNPQNIPGDIKDVAIGTGRMLGALAASPWDVSILKDLAVETLQSYARRYGSNWEEYAKNDPLFGIMDAIAFGNVVARGAEVAMNAGRLGWRAAIKESYRPSDWREVIDPKTMEGVRVPKGVSPVMRATQDLYDLYSRHAPEKMPASAARRVSAAKKRFPHTSAVTKEITTTGGPRGTVPVTTTRVRGEAAEPRRPPAGDVKQWVDIASNMTKAAVMYTNPGYYVANLLGNLALLGLSYDPVSAVMSLGRARRLHTKSPDIWRKIAEETGDGPMGSLTVKETTGKGWKGRMLDRQRGLAHKVGFVDRGPRVAAWLHEAARHGYKTDDQIRALLHTGGDDLAQISQRTRHAMVDFDAMHPSEREYIRRLIFVYPWLRGSAKYAKDYATGRPERASVVANVANATNQEWEDRWQQELGYVPDLPSWLQQAFPLHANKDKGLASVVNASSVSPFGTVGEILRYLQGVAHPLDPVPKYGAIFEAFNPPLQSAANFVQGKDPYGSNVGYSESFQYFLEDVVPLLSFAKQLTGDVSDVYANKSPLATLARRSFRVLPYTIDLDEAANRAVSEGTEVSTPGERARRDIAQEQQTVTKAWRQQGGSPPAVLKKVYARKADMDAMRADLQKRVGRDDPNYKRLALEGEVRLYLKWGILSRDSYLRIVQMIRVADEETLKAIRGKVSAANEKAITGPIRKARAKTNYQADDDE